MLDSQTNSVEGAADRPRRPKLNFRLAANAFLLAVLVVSLITNQAVMSKNAELMGMGSGNFISELSAKLRSGSSSLSGNLGADAMKLAFTQGPAAVYGPELGVNFDQVQESMDIMKRYDPTYGASKIVLSGDLLKRYINVGLRISCEYCCGAKAIIREDGEAACGCAHSQAMRGLAAYLLQNHSSEYSDDQILRELARWKGRFFPKQMITKMSDQLQSGQYTPDVAALLLEVKLPKYSGSNGSVPLPKDLPSMVGGC